MKVRKIPLRKCTACNEMKVKKEMIRVVKNKENEIFIDPTGKKAGRGAYLCPNIACLNRARKSKALEKSLLTSIPQAIYDQIEEELIKIYGE